MRLRTKRSLAVAALAVVTLGGAAIAFSGCGSSTSTAGSDSGPCNMDPRACKAGTTCWVSDDVGDYACLPSGAAGEGQMCMNEIGVAECADGLDCLQLPHQNEGVCVRTCSRTDPSYGCPDGASCTKVILLLDEGGTSPAEIYVCPPAGGPGDGGVESGPADSGNDATGNDAAPPLDAGDAG